MTMTSALSTTPASPSSASSPDDLPARAGVSRTARNTGLGLGILISAFLLFDATIKLSSAPEAMKGTQELGYSLSVLKPLGWLELACLVLYWVPRTQLLGALLWTGYLGGAIATHVRVGNPWATHILFPVYVALFLWGSLWLRDRRVRALLPFRSAPQRSPERV